MKVKAEHLHNEIAINRTYKNICDDYNRFLNSLNTLLKTVGFIKPEKYDEFMSRLGIKEPINPKDYAKKFFGNNSIDHT